jgi:membrane protein YqaA with SNARE-associated domain
VIQIVYLVSVLTLYYFGLVDFGRLVLYSIMFVGSIGLCYLAYKVQGKKQPISGSKEDKERYKRAYVLIGGVTGLFLSFFGTVFLTFISIRLGGPNFIRMINGPWEFFLLATVLIVSGSVIGYYLGKRNNFGKPKWMDKIDERFGF